MRFMNPWLVRKLLAKSHILKIILIASTYPESLLLTKSKWSRVFSLNVINLSKPVSQRIE